MLRFAEFYDLFEEAFDTVSEFFLNPEHSSKTFTQVMREFKQSGGEVLGQGSFGIVLSHPSWPYILKLFPRDDCYLKFVRFTYSHPFPSYPKFYGLPKRILPQFMRGLTMENPYIVRMEKLVSPSNSYQVADQIEEMLLDLREKGIHDDSEYTLAKHVSIFGSSNAQYFNIIKGLLMMRDTLKECKLDIHGGNIMFREKDNEWVWVDPVWSGWSSEGHLRSKVLNRPIYEPAEIRAGKRHSEKPNRYKRYRETKKRQPVTVS